MVVVFFLIIELYCIILLFVHINTYKQKTLTKQRKQTGGEKENEEQNLKFFIFTTLNVDSLTGYIGWYRPEVIRMN